MAGQVMDVDNGKEHVDAEDLSPRRQAGEIRRLTIVFAGLVDSTALSKGVTRPYDAGGRNATGRAISGSLWGPYRLGEW